MNLIFGKRKRENIEEDKRLLCQKCRQKNAKYNRKFDYHKLPHKYFHQPEGTFGSLVYGYGLREDQIYPRLWINVPADKILTTYDWRLCRKCYKSEKMKHIEEWNEWIKIEKIMEK